MTPAGNRAYPRGMSHLIAKVCGFTTVDAMSSALDAGVDMVGLNFFPKSPRFIPVAQAAELAAMAEGRAVSVALVVDADDALITLIRDAVRPRMVQLHGLETPERVREIRALSELPVMKVLGVATAADLAAVPDFAKIADLLLLDAKPPKNAAYPGGHGRPFDWTLLSAMPKDVPFLLAGGLTPENVADAVQTVRALGLDLRGVDVASGVESAPGVKDAEKIKRFVFEAHNASS